MAHRIDDSWTRTHDLAFIFIAIAYGADHDLADAEMKAMTKILREWDDLSEEESREVLVEVIALFTQESVNEDLTRSIKSLKRHLDPAARRRAIEDAIRIAEADGVVLDSEKSFLSTLAREWAIKLVGNRLDYTDTDETPWTLLHDVAFLYIVVSHSADGELNDAEIETMKERLAEWQPDATADEVKKVLGEALQYYAQEFDEQALAETVHSLDEGVDIVKKLAVLNDMVHIAEADGALMTEEVEIINTLSEAWEIGIQLGVEEEF